MTIIYILIYFLVIFFSMHMYLFTYRRSCWAFLYHLLFLKIYFYLLLCYIQFLFLNLYVFLFFKFFKYQFIYFNWRLISLQYCTGFAMHWLESSCTCVPHILKWLTAHLNSTSKNTYYREDSQKMAEHQTSISL